MLDKRTNAVLQLLNEQAGEGYNVLEKRTLLQHVPEKFALDMREFCSVISFLKEQKYIDVKYHDKDTICLSVTAKTRNYLQGWKDTTGAKLGNNQFVSLLLCVGACAFVGAFVAMLLGQLIF